MIHRKLLPMPNVTQIWIHIPNERPSTHSTIDTNARADRLAEMRGIIEKKTMINLVSSSLVTPLFPAYLCLTFLDSSFRRCCEGV